MTEDILKKGNMLSDQMSALKNLITGCEALLKELQKGNLVVSTDAIPLFQYRVDDELGEYMISHYKKKLRGFHSQLELLEQQFKQL